MFRTKTRLVESKNNFLYLLASYHALLQPYRREYALILFGISTQVAFYVLYPLAFKTILDQAIPNRDFPLLIELIIEVSILLVVCGIGAFVQIRYMAKVGGRVLSNMRHDMAHKLNMLGFGFHSRVETVDLLTRFSNDMDRIENSLTRALPALVESALVTLGCLMTIVFIDWRMGLVALILLPVGFAGNALFGGREDRLNSQSRSLKNHMLVSVEDFSKSWHLIHAYNDRKLIKNRFARHNADYTRTATDQSYYANIAPVFSDYGINMSLTVIVLAGAVLAMKGSLTVGALVGCFALLRKVADGSAKSAKTYAAYITALRPYQRVQKLLNEDVSIAEHPLAVDIPALEKEIRFQGVTYGYSPEKTVLRGLDFVIEAGTSVAIVGASGSGKSTILKLIMRIIDPVGGTVTFDGLDIRQATLDSVRRNTGNVLQDSHIIRGTLAENLRFAKPDATDEEIVEAARKAEIHDFIMGLPQGYETLVDDRGSALSGGQRQRIAIARALVPDPGLLFLDEPTSMLDPLTEGLINHTIEHLSADRTVIMTTHRLASVRKMDQILVLHNGLIAESGSHDELLSLNGLYRSMWDKQHGFTISAEGTAIVSPERLQAIPIFSGLDLKVLGELAEHFNPETFEPGTTVIREGAKGRKFYIAVRGSLEVFKTGVDGVERPLGVIQGGDHFGEIALLHWVPRTASVRALTNTQCLSLSRERFMRLVEAQPALRDSLEASISSRH